MEENNIKNDEIRDQSIIDSAEDTNSLFKKLLPLLFALLLAVLLFLFFNKGSNLNQTEIQSPANDTSAIISMDSTSIAVAIDSTVVDSTK